MLSFHTLLLTLFAICCNATSTFNPLRPPALPLAVKSPYMSTWQQAGSDGGNGGYLVGQWPTFWYGSITGWEGLIRVDNKTYTWMGNSPQNQNYAQQTAYNYTSTRSIFTFNVGGLVQMTVTFLSPVTPDDLTRSSLPYTYLDVAVQTLDGKVHSVQLYTDISAEWVAGDRTATAQWSYGVVTGTSTPKHFAAVPKPKFPSTIVPTTYATKTSYSLQTSVVRTNAPISAVEVAATSAAAQKRDPLPSSIETADQAASTAGGVAYHRVWRQQQLQFAEYNQQAEWGYWYYSTSNTKALTHQSGADVDVRGQFIQYGKLANTQDKNYRAIDDDYPVFGFATNLGNVGKRAKSTVFQLSLHQQNCVRFEATNGNETVPCLWTNYFSTEQSAVNFFYNDYQTGSSMATTFDNQVASDSIAAGGQDYLSLTSLAVRQAFGALEFTNTPTQPWVFMKEISSDGNVQTVDVIFPFHPIAIYANATILRYMLDPLFINQKAGWWPYAFSIHDLGTNFPNATGHNGGNDEMMPVEECGNMIIMTLAYAQRANDTAYLAQNYEILKQWNNYLVNDSLIPMDQLSTDDFAGALANQTNLAIKGIIGIGAMAEIASLVGKVEDAKNFTNISTTYVKKWMGYAIAQPSAEFSLPHTTLAYGMNNTYSLLYNVFGDKELGLGLVPQSVYDMQSAFYPTQFRKYGVPLDTRHLYTKADWQIFCASVSSASTANEFISTLATWLDQTPTNYPFTDLYNTTTGNYPSGITFIARPVVGGMFAPLALNSAPSASSAKKVTTRTRQTKRKARV